MTPKECMKRIHSLRQEGKTIENASKIALTEFDNANKVTYPINECEADYTNGIIEHIKLEL